ncbi:Zona pellucida sperm-binding protein 4 [Bagarius yarrelli]|uniref:Zona pellucida sperm-binding protein 4 n=1 Tax=Bagarius yarrelli TaxID=175774 RepID=A0A556TPQ8_BAGYA|nr:Zona pellucida sperm-binding protein 4 [Bagarius yarrelli]
MVLKPILSLLVCCIELFIVQTFDYVYQDSDYYREGTVSSESAVPSQEDWLKQHKYSVFCGKHAVEVVFPSGSFSDVKVLESSTKDPAQGATTECGYSLTKVQENEVLHVSFSSCHVAVEEGRYVLRLLHFNNTESAEVSTVSCDVDTSMTLEKARVPRSNGEDDCEPAPLPPMTPKQKLPQDYTRGGCDIPTSQRLPCGPAETTASECANKGCCLDVAASYCYYPMDQCTADKQFVFTIYANITTIPVNPSSLIVAGTPPCKPVFANNEFATFKFSGTECGTKTFTIGDTTVYMAEIRTALKVLNLKVMVECRYSEVGPTMMRASAGYMVVSPSVPSTVKSHGLYGVQLRIAEDETFSSFSERGHLPLSVLLGKPLYLEVQLNSPKPKATLLINYCVAYTRSGTNALVLLYEGCPDPDLSDRTSFLRVLDLPQTPHQRRFVVTAFQFMNVTSQRYLNEETFDYAYQDSDYYHEGTVSLESPVPNQEDWLKQHHEYSVFCGKDAVKVTFPSAFFSEVKVLESSIEDPVLGVTTECGYSLTKVQGKIILHVSFSSCHITVKKGRYVLRLLHFNNTESAEVSTVSCDVDTSMTLEKARVPRSNGEDDCEPAPLPAMTPKQKLPQDYTRGECTADKQFVFTIYANITTIPVNPSSLFVAGTPPCKPVFANNEFATFKFSVTECGTKTFTIGDTTVYMAEIRTALKVLNLKVMVECRYSEVGPTMMRASAGYMVVSPSIPSTVKSHGLYGVQLRIAEDETFSSFSEYGHLPLNVLLGKPLYLEVSLNSPKPKATLLINYCVAYTRSGTNALILLYEGCPDPDLSSDRTSLLRVLDLPQTPNQRRFVVTAFQFMNVTSQRYLTEEIYFMCSTEVCLPSETPCPKTCFDGNGSPLSLQVYKRYPEGLGKALYREQFDFNAEPPWDPS